MRLTPNNVTTLGDGLDHPEGVCIGPDGSIYAGGEAGQLYRISPDGSQQQVVATTGGFLLGIAIDGQGRIHGCDLGKNAIVRIDPDGSVRQRSAGVQGRALEVPNYCVFDADGNLYVTDSGDYWSEKGTGYVMVVRPDDTAEMFHGGPFRFANGLAIDPTGKWLYVIQSTASNIVRVPLDQLNGPVEITHRLPPGSVPDGMAFTSDGSLLIGCYKPDALFLGHPDGRVELFCEDPTGELLNRPANVALYDGKIYISNLGGWHVGVIETDLRPGPIHRPMFS